MQCRCSAARLTIELIQEGRKERNTLQQQEELVRNQITWVYLLSVNTGQLGSERKERTVGEEESVKDVG